MALNDKQNEAVAKFLIDMVKIVVTVFIIGGLVPNSPISAVHFIIAALSAAVMFVIAIYRLRGDN